MVRFELATGVRGMGDEARRGMLRAPPVVELVGEALLAGVSTLEGDGGTLENELVFVDELSMDTSEISGSIACFFDALSCFAAAFG